MGETVTSLNKRMNMHRTTIIHKHQNLVGQHFNNGVCSIDDLTVHPIEQINGDGRNPMEMDEILVSKNFENYVNYTG